MKKILSVGAALVAAVALTFAVQTSHKDANAQQALTYAGYGPGGNTAVGTFVGVYNASDSLIYDGEVLMADTTTVAQGNLRRIGVKRYDGAALSKPRVVGIAVGNIQTRARRGTGRALVWGYHPGAFIAESSAPVNQPIKLGPVVACFSKIDTLTATCGYLISRSSAAVSSPGPRYKYKVYFWGSRITGATL